MLLSPRTALISLAMALSQHGDLPDTAANTHGHFQTLLRRPHQLEEATYTGGVPAQEVVEWVYDEAIWDCVARVWMGKDVLRQLSWIMSSGHLSC